MPPADRPPVAGVNTRKSSTRPPDLPVQKPPTLLAPSQVHDERLPVAPDHARLESARTDAELAELEQEARRVFERLRALPTPSTREGRRSLGRAKTAVRVTRQTVGWLFRVHGFAMRHVFDRVIEVVHLAAETDSDTALDLAVEMLTRIAGVARSIRSWTPS